jgi:hypothetical protein
MRKYILIDHVAMVLKFETEPDEVFILETTVSNGVSIIRWKNFRMYKHEIYDR